MLAPSAPGNEMSWPSTVGSLADTESGLRATGEDEPTTLGEAAGEAAGLAGAIMLEGLAAGAGLAAAAGLGEAPVAAVGLGAAVAAAGALVGAPAAPGQPSVNRSVAVVPRPPVMFSTRCTRSRRKRCPAL